MVGFFDYLKDHNKNFYFSLGLELCLETKVCFGFLQLLPGIGLALNRDMELKIIFNIKTGTMLFNLDFDNRDR